MGVFLILGSAAAFFAFFTLTWRGTPLDHAWALNPDAYKQLTVLGRGIGLLFLALSAGLAMAAVGWFKRRRWGWTLAVVIIAAQVAGDLVNAITGHFAKGALGVVIAGGLLVYLLRRPVRSAFASASE